MALSCLYFVVSGDISVSVVRILFAGPCLCGPVLVVHWSCKVYMRQIVSHSSEYQVFDWETIHVVAASLELRRFSVSIK